MSKSQRLRQSDVRAVQRLVGECRELWYDALAWRTRMFAGLCALSGSQCAIGGERSGIRIGQVRTLQTITWGLTPRAVEVFQQYMARGDLTVDLPQHRLYQRLKTLTQRVSTADQQQFVAPREWRRSELYNEYVRPSELEYRLFSYYEFPSAAPGSSHSVHQGMTFHRLRGEHPFGERERRIVDCFHEQCGPLIGSALASVAIDPLAALPPRVGQTLMLLLAGETEKGAAARLGISRHTLHDNVKQLHRHFGVSHRRELLVRCRALVARSQALAHSAEEPGLTRIVYALPPRVQQALALLLDGATDADIARRLNISSHTARDYAKRVYAEIGVSNRAELFARCQTFVCSSSHLT